MPLTKDVLNPLVKSLLIPVGSTAAASVKDAAIHKKIFGSAMTTLIISNEEMNDTWKQLGLLKNLVYLLKAPAKQLKMTQINKKKDFSVCY